MARNSKTKVETIVIVLLFIIGAAGAFFFFSGSDNEVASPGHSLENPAAVYQVSMNDEAPDRQ